MEFCKLWGSFTASNDETAALKSLTFRPFNLQHIVLPTTGDPVCLFRSFKSFVFAFDCRESLVDIRYDSFALKHIEDGVKDVKGCQ